MERRNFLKGIFGAATIAIMPKFIADRIEKLPPPIINRHDKKDKQSSSGGNDILMIYDDEKLVGYSSLFSVNNHSPVQQMYGGSWKEVTVGIKKNGKKRKKLIYVPSQEPEFIPLPKSWDIQASNIVWKNGPEGLFGSPLHCMIVCKGIKMKGDAYIGDIEGTGKPEDQMSYSASFTGSGKLEVI